MSVEKDIVEAIDIIVSKKMENTTQIYNGAIQESATGKVMVNGKIYELSIYGETNTVKGQLVKVFVPQGNFSQAFILNI